MAATAVTWTGRQAVVHPGGDVTAADVPELRSVMRDALAQGALEMLVDFAGVTKIDSAGIGLLMSAHNSMTKAGGCLAVFHARKEIVESLRSLHIHQHFAISE